MLEVTLYEYNALLTRRYYVFTVKLFDEEMYNGFERGGEGGGGPIERVGSLIGFSDL